MSTIKNILVTAISVTVTSIAWVVGTGVGKTIWENGLEDKVRNKTQELFSK